MEDAWVVGSLSEADLGLKSASVGTSLAVEDLSVGVGEVRVTLVLRPGGRPLLGSQEREL